MDEVLEQVALLKAAITKAHKTAVVEDDHQWAGFWKEYHNRVASMEHHLLQFNTLVHS